MNTLIIGLLGLISILLARLVQKWHYHRTLFRGLPQPPHSMLWGHLRVLGEHIASEPPRSASQTWFYTFGRKHNLPSIYYLDLWPASEAFVVITDPRIIPQITGLKGHKNLLKHDKTREFIASIGGWDTNLVTSEGALWKKWRAVFNPGFSVNHLMTLVPSIVEHSVKFRDLMIQKGQRGELFRLEKPCTRLTIDIMGSVILDHDLQSQFRENPLVSAFESQIRWIRIGAMQHPSELIDIRRPFMQWKNRRIMNAYVSQIIDERFATMKKRGKQKYVIDLALETYLREEKGQSLEQATEVDPEFKKHALDHIKTFLFAGHDTTSATIQYAYYQLWKHPEVLAKARAEHDEVFGKDPFAAPELISADPYLLNRLPYSNAIIKEILRLHPPASTIREGDLNVPLVDPTTGKTYPVFKTAVLMPTLISMHRDEEFWGPTCHDFIPERFLPSHPSYTETSINSAYMPFSKGPRNCIGQELALIETRVILALTLRSFDVRICYDELDALRGDGSGYVNDTAGEQFGEVAYQVQLGTAKPREGMPARIVVRER